MSTDFIEYGRFIESFDTVRNGEEDENRKKHAEIELMLSLLFGEPMVVSEPQSFDSLGFLKIATEVIDCRPKYIKRSHIYNPFVLALRPGHNSYRDMIYSLLRKENFIPSGWSKITDIDERQTLASLIKDGKFDEAICSFNDYSDSLEQLERLDKYFCKASPIYTKEPYIPLTDYTGYLAKLDIAELPPYLESYKESISDLKDAVELLGKKNIDLTNRSVIRLHGKDYFDEKIFKGILEYVDSCYNRVVASSVTGSVKEGTSIFSTDGDGENEYVLAAKDLTHSAMDAFSNNKSLSTNYSLCILPYEKIETKFKLDWTEIWDVLTDKTFFESVNNLHKALNSDYRTADQALSTHINLLSKSLQQVYIYKSGHLIKAGPTGTGTVVGGILGAAVGYVFQSPALSTIAGVFTSAVLSESIKESNLMKWSENFLKKTNIKSDLWNSVGIMDGF